MPLAEKSGQGQRFLGFGRYKNNEIIVFISLCPARKLVHKFNTGPTLRASQKDSIKVKLIQTVFHASVGGIAHERKIHTCFDYIIREQVSSGIRKALNTVIDAISL